MSEEKKDQVKKASKPWWRTLLEFVGIMGETEYHKRIREFKEQRSKTEEIEALKSSLDMQMKAFSEKERKAFDDQKEGRITEAENKRLRDEIEGIRITLGPIQRDPTKPSKVISARLNIDQSLTEKELKEFCESTKVIIDENKKEEMINFIKVKIQPNSEDNNYRKVYKRMFGDELFGKLEKGVLSEDDKNRIAVKFANRLLHNRPMACYAKQSTMYMRDGTFLADGREYLNTIESHYERLEANISLAETEFSRDIAVSGLTHLYTYKDGVHTKVSDAPIFGHAHVGIRLEIKDTPEYVRLVIHSEKGGATDLYNSLVTKLPEDKRTVDINNPVSISENDKRYLYIGNDEKKNPIFINADEYKAMIKEAYAKYIADSLRMAQLQNKDPMIVINTLGLTSWAAVDGCTSDKKTLSTLFAGLQADVLEEVIRDALKINPNAQFRLNETSQPDKMKFSQADRARLEKIGKNFAIEEVYIGNYPSGYDKDKHLLCINNSWDGLSDNGNEFYLGDTAASLDPRFANQTNTTTTFTGINPLLNLTNHPENLLMHSPNGKINPVMKPEPAQAPILDQVEVKADTDEQALESQKEAADLLEKQQKEEIENFNKEVKKPYEEKKNQFENKIVSREESVKETDELLKKLDAKLKADPINQNEVNALMVQLAAAERKMNTLVSVQGGDFRAPLSGAENISQSLSSKEYSVDSLKNEKLKIMKEVAELVNRNDSLKKQYDSLRKQVGEIKSSPSLLNINKEIQLVDKLRKMKEDDIPSARDDLISGADQFKIENENQVIQSYENLTRELKAYKKYIGLYNSKLSSITNEELRKEVEKDYKEISESMNTILGKLRDLESRIKAELNLDDKTFEALQDFRLTSQSIQFDNEKEKQLPERRPQAMTTEVFVEPVEGKEPAPRFAENPVGSVKEIKTEYFVNKELREKREKQTKKTQMFHRSEQKDFTETESESLAQSVPEKSVLKKTDVRSELKPYWDALLQSLDKADKHPELCIYKFENLRSAMEAAGLKFERDLRKLELTFGGIPEIKHQALANIGQFNQHIAGQKMSDAKDQFISDFLETYNTTNASPTLAASRKYTKLAEDFVQKEKSFNKLLKQDDPFMLIRLGRAGNYSARILGRYDRTRNLPIDLVVRYILQHPDTAHDFLKKRFLFGRDFRGELYKNPELIDMLIRSKNKTILDEITNSNLLASNRLSDIDKNRLSNQLKSQNELVNATSVATESLSQTASGVASEGGRLARAASLLDSLTSLTESSLSRDKRAANIALDLQIDELLSNPKEAAKLFNTVLTQIDDPKYPKIKDAVINHAVHGDEDAIKALAEAYIKLDSNLEERASFEQWFNKGLDNPKTAVSLFDLALNRVNSDSTTVPRIVEKLSAHYKENNVDAIVALAGYYRSGSWSRDESDKLIKQLANLYNTDLNNSANDEENIKQIEDKWLPILTKFPTIRIEKEKLVIELKQKEVESIVSKDDKVTKEDLIRLFKYADQGVYGAESFIFTNPTLVEMHNLQTEFNNYFDRQPGGENSQQAYLLINYPDNPLLQAHWKALKSMELLSDDELDAAIEEVILEADVKDSIELVVQNPIQVDWQVYWNEYVDFGMKAWEKNKQMNKEEQKVVRMQAHNAAALKAGAQLLNENELKDFDQRAIEFADKTYSEHLGVSSNKSNKEEVSNKAALEAYQNIFMQDYEEKLENELSGNTQSLDEVNLSDEKYSIIQVMPITLPVGGYKKLLSLDQNIVSELIQNLSDCQNELEKNTDPNDASMIQKNIDTIIHDLQGFAKENSSDAAFALAEHYGKDGSSYNFKLAQEWHKTTEDILEQELEQLFKANQESAVQKSVDIDACKKALNEIKSPGYKAQVLAAFDKSMEKDNLSPAPSVDDIKAFVVEANEKLKTGLTYQDHLMFAGKHNLSHVLSDVNNEMFGSGLKIRAPQQSGSQQLNTPSPSAPLPAAPNPSQKPSGLS